MLENNDTINNRTLIWNNTSPSKQIKVTKYTTKGLNKILY